MSRTAAGYASGLVARPNLSMNPRRRGAISLHGSGEQTLHEVPAQTPATLSVRVALKPLM